MWIAAAIPFGKLEIIVNIVFCQANMSTINNPCLSLRIQKFPPHYNFRKTSIVETQF